MAKKNTSAPAKTTASTVPPVQKIPRKLRDSANQFLSDANHVLYTRGKKLGDLMAIVKEVENFLAIEHPILNEPVE